MSSHHICIYCGRRIERHVKGRPATPAQIQHVASLHSSIEGDYVCETHRRHPRQDHQLNEIEVPLRRLRTRHP